MCTSAFVEPPIACRVTSALWNASGVMIRSGRRSSAAISTARLPVRSAKRSRSACTAGMVAPPGSIMPSASVMQAMVLAVPITMQVPAVGASRSFTSSISASSSSPARYMPQKRRQSVHAPSRSPRQCPVIIGPVERTRAGTSALAAAMS